MSNSLDPDHARHSVGPDLDPSCLQRLSADNKIRRWQAKSNDTCKDNRWLTYINAINESCFCVIFHLMLQTSFCRNLISQSTQTQHILINLYQKEELPGRVAQSVACLATDVYLTADPGVASSIPVRSHTFVEK